ncbi:tetratricopeptide repeat protein [Candidatus Thioglobus sp.]|nr:tetratricopeptide repeat protein [Candidatus Thioglobus sp.]
MGNQNLQKLDRNNLVSIINDINKGRTDKALVALDKLIKSFPDEALLFNLRGACHEAMNQFDQSIESFSKALEIHPHYEEALYNLGVVQKKAGKPDDAINSYQRAIGINSKNANAYNNLGNLLTQKGHIKQSIEHLNLALNLNPKFAEAHNNLGLANMELNKLHECINNFLLAIENNPQYEGAYINLGRVYRELDEFDNELNCYKKFLKIKPNASKILVQLGRAYRNSGENKLAIDCFESSLNFNPESYSAYFELANGSEYKLNKEQIAKMESFAENDGLNDEDKIKLNYALALIYEKNEDSDKLFSSLHRANSLRKKSLNYSLHDDEKRANNVKDFYQGSSNAKEIKLHEKSKSKNPIFIVGMPRSGSSLIEQILSSHHNVYGGGELQIFRKILNPLINTFLNDRESFQEIIKDKNCYESIRYEYLESIDRLDFKEAFFTDKALLNFQYIGLILRALPDSKIIHIKRDAMAICWSNFKTNFAQRGIAFSNDLNDLVGFYKLYEEQMNFWHSEFPNQIYDLKYESMTKNQTIETKELLNFCNLDWDENCLHFYNNNRSVKTASKDQVRKKIYSGSSDAWKKYKNYLEPLTKGLVDIN